MEDISDTDDYKPSSPEVLVVGESSSSSVVINTPPHQPQDITYSSNGDSTTTEVVVTPTVHVNNITVSKEQIRRELAEIRKHNLDVRSKVYKEVRRPGKSKLCILSILPFTVILHIACYKHYALPSRFWPSFRTSRKSERWC